MRRAQVGRKQRTSRSGCAGHINGKENQMRSRLRGSGRVVVLGLMIGVCAVVMGAGSPDAASAACLQQVAGAYLTTITNGPTVTSRSTILLNMEGTMSVVDSGQGTVGFTSAQGTWDCQVQQGQRELQATALDFNTAGDTIFRTDYQATFDPQAETLT